MSTPYLMCRKRYSSLMVGGGVRGMGVGTDPITMTEVGLIIVMLHLFMQICIRVGEMISDIIGGEDNRGIISGYHNRILIAIGVPGKETDIGTVEDMVTALEDIQISEVKGSRVSKIEDSRECKATAV
jgi:hypothetical protein